MTRQRGALFLVYGMFAVAMVFATDVAFAEKSCCDKAKEKGQACSHPCCVAAVAKHTICFKCNPDKKTCCDKAQLAGKGCSHPCCASAQAVGFICTRCNPGRSVALFDGELADWKAVGVKDWSHWKVGKAALNSGNDRQLTVSDGGQAMVNVLGGEHGHDIYSIAKFGDAIIELEVMVPKGSNSGIYVMGEYEIQVLDSYGKKKLGMGDMGAVYGAAAPPINACKPAGEWQTFLIDFRAPRFDKSGKKVKNARLVKVALNGKVLHENLELGKHTPGGVTGREHPIGPLMFQGNHGEVAYRNIYITPLAGSPVERLACVFPWERPST